MSGCGKCGSAETEAYLHGCGPKPGYQPWRCERCRATRWVGWAAGPGMPRWAQCVPCGHVQNFLNRWAQISNLHTDPRVD